LLGFGAERALDRCHMWNSIIDGAATELTGWSN
jgi:hypothetical protein